MKEHRIQLLFGIVLVFIWLFTIQQKQGFFIDEYLTFVLSNHVIDGSDFSPQLSNNMVIQGNELLDKFMLVQDGEEFNFNSVIHNQIIDVHPPLYYLCIHILSSLLKGRRFIFFTCMGFNLLIAIFCYYFLTKIVYDIIQKEKMAVIISFFYMTSLTFLNNLLLVRMYMMLTLFSIMFFYEIGVCINCKNIQKKNIIYLFCISILGSLTQYYFIVFMIVTCIFTAGVLIHEKRWKDVIKGFVTIVFSLGVAYKIFPGMKKHIFEGYRGPAAIESAKANDNWQNIKLFCELINQEILIGYLTEIIILAIVMTIVIIVIRKQRNMKLQINILYVLLIWTTMVTFFIIAKISPMQEDRYIFNISWGFFIEFMILVYFLGENIYFSEKWRNRTLIVIMLFFSVISLKGGIPNAFKEEKQNIEMIKNYSAKECYYVYEKRYEVLSNFFEMENIGEIHFLDGNEQQSQIEGRKKEPFILYIDNSYNQEEMLKEILDLSQYNYKELFKYGYATAYEILMK